MASEAAEIISHLIVRNDHIRGTLANAFRDMFVKMGDAINQEETLRLVMGIDADGASPFQKALDDFTKNNPQISQSKIPKDTIKKIATTIAQENFTNIFASISPNINQVVAKIVARSPEMARSGHAKALESELSPVIRVKN